MGTILILVKTAPTLKSPIMVSGIQTKARALAWAEKRGFTTVYYWKRLERAYAERG